MLSPRSALVGVGGGLSIAVSLLASAGVAHAIPDEGHGKIQLAGANASVGYYERDGRITRLHGEAFSHGATPEASAQAFVDANARLFNLEAGDLVLGGPFADGHHVQPIMYQPDTGTYKFTGVYYRQTTDGIPVYGSRLTLLVRNEPGHPLVLASMNIRPTAGFDPADAVAAAAPARGVNAALQLAPSLTNFTDPQMVIWAGVDDMLVQPVLAYAFTGDNGEPADGSPPEIYEFVADATNGTILYMEDKIIFEDVVGNVQGMATEGVGAEHCEDEVPTVMPYARVNIGGTVAYADATGDFVIPWGGTSPVTVESPIRGQWFTVDNAAGANSLLSALVTPPGPADFLHNEANTSEYVRAEVNGYVQANVVRDFALEQNPSYPALQQTEFPVNVNRSDGYCPGNAWYSGSSINFCRTGAGYPNTAWSSVIHHEYGHHLVEVAGSGQGEYGEGMGDVMGLLIADVAGTGFGFFGPCAEPLRTADNTIQYPCSGEIHYCGQLLSGCVWSTRNELAVTNPSTYMEILANIAVNAMLLHGGSGIDPSITVDYLTLDDDDGNIGNGTPHYMEIAAGFGAHNMDAPPLMLLGFEFPFGLPDIIAPGGGTVVRVAVTSIAGEPEPDTGKIHYDAGLGWVTVSMTQVEPHVYEFAFPAVNCGQQVRYWFSANTTTGQSQYYPTGAPNEFLSAISAQSGEVAFSDDFETNLGWTTSGNASDGQWDRGVPVDCDRGDPPTDADGSGQCSLTDNSSANFCNSDVDGGTTILTSPVMDATGDGAIISYWRWYSNTYGADPMNDTFVVEVSDNAGSTWTQLETVGPTGPEVDGGWFLKQFRVDDYVALTDQFRIRFLASDLINPSVVEAGVDGVELMRFSCAGGCPADVNGDNTVDVLDLLDVLAAWGATGGVEDINGDGIVNVLDLLEVLSAWGPC